MMILLASLAVISLLLCLWQLGEGLLFPLHRKIPVTWHPDVTLLKPVKGVQPQMMECLRSWLTLEYSGNVQILFGVASPEDPVCDVINQLLSEHPEADAQLIICAEAIGPNAKVSTLAQLQPHAKHSIWVLSDADVCAKPDFLAQVVQPLSRPDVGLVNCFYKLANPTTLAMRWESVAINADFWSQVLLARRTGPLNFALGAALAVKREAIEKIGGFEALRNYLADDFQLGNRIFRAGYKLELLPSVVYCFERPQDWRAIWNHQVRWARTIRVSNPGGYFGSILSNATWWAFLLAAASFSPVTLLGSAGIFAARMATAGILQWRFTRDWSDLLYLWLVPIKDFLQVALWISAYVGSRISWRGLEYRLLSTGEMIKRDPAVRSHSAAILK